MGGYRGDPDWRFMRHVKKVESGCWERQACLNAGGYGVFNDGLRRGMLTHRFSYRLHKKELPIDALILAKGRAPGKQDIDLLQLFLLKRWGWRNSKIARLLKIPESSVGYYISGLRRPYLRKMFEQALAVQEESA